MIVINQLTKSFGEFVAVNNLSFDVKPGDVVGFLGPNGAGKSTTMKMITGFLQATSGTVKVCDYDIEENPQAIKELIGYLPEGAPAYGDMTVAQFLDFTLLLKVLAMPLQLLLLELVIIVLLLLLKPVLLLLALLLEPSVLLLLLLWLLLEPIALLVVVLPLEPVGLLPRSV